MVRAERSRRIASDRRLDRGGKCEVIMLQVLNTSLNRARAAREEIRAGRFVGQTSTIAPGVVQGNVVIVPEDYAADFKQYCAVNPKPCALIDMSAPGDPFLPQLGDIDIRTDVPSYYIFRDGERTAELNDIRGLWRSDLVTFVLGCSFSFEEALADAALTPRHVEMGCNVPMYIANIPTTPAGPFRGNTIVTMRPYTAEQTIEAIQITARFPRNHGAPVYFGDPRRIGIPDINKPDFGDRVEIREHEIPVFWACGATPQVAITHARPPICITHKPGCMLITDRLSEEFMA
jgi:uncharacterized protein YcsI (UPF0317 family)